jgi:hypothetical protein
MIATYSAFLKYSYIFRMVDTSITNDWPAKMKCCPGKMMEHLWLSVVSLIAPRLSSEKDDIFRLSAFKAILFLTKLQTETAARQHNTGLNFHRLQDDWLLRIEDICLDPEILNTPASFSQIAWGICRHNLFTVSCFDAAA